MRNLCLTILPNIHLVCEDLDEWLSACLDRINLRKLLVLGAYKTGGLPSEWQQRSISATLDLQPVSRNLSWLGALTAVGCNQAASHVHTYAAAAKSSDALSVSSRLVADPLLERTEDFAYLYICNYIANIARTMTMSQTY